MASDEITITPPTIRLTMKMPRLYGLRLLIASWFIAAADRVAGGALEVVMMSDEMDPASELRDRR
ncbi:hypothetical protein EMQ25_05665 [Arsenicitalea aurantiaca]|uniref:Uncharacterized protein n=1 Tax=Arsenicitalea aurantiaca TaxID=1783274 RepID=A0A433XF55_9HYPH|nr:hypothetical protein [Arsenicitalea aurantiaca]RUT32634.1 hypothetical protein EMQ25_05665 [Arsenicitalea aurantiaca]